MSVDSIIQETPMGLYLQDKHPIRDGVKYAVMAEEHGFEHQNAEGLKEQLHVWEQERSISLSIAMIMCARYGQRD